MMPLWILARHLRCMRLNNLSIAHSLIGAGEMVKSVASLMDGYIEVTNCAFLDGVASGFNFNFTHRDFQLHLFEPRHG